MSTVTAKLQIYKGYGKALFTNFIVSNYAL